MNSPKPKLFRIATVPMSLNLLLKGQLRFLNDHFEVTAISGSGDDLEMVAKREGVKVHPIVMHRPISLYQDIKSLWQLYLYFKKEKPDIIHSITPKAGLLSMVAGKLAGVPVRMHTFTGLIFPNEEGYMKGILILMDRILCHCATKIIPEGEGVKNDLLKYGITRKPLEIIANGNVNGIDLDYFENENVSEEDKNNVREHLEIHKDDFIFIFIGRIGYEKGINELIEAFIKLKKTFTSFNAKLLLVGPLENNHLISSENILEIFNNENILSVGYQENVRKYLSISNALVFPSYREGFPNVVMEALAMKLPAIVTDVNGSNEIVTNEFNGIVLPPKDSDSLLNAMNKIYFDGDFLENLKNNTRQSVVDKYCRYKVWNSILDIYNQLLNDRKKS